MTDSLGTADQILRAAVYDVAVNAAYTAAVAAEPWLASPVISQIFRMLLNKFADILYPELQKYLVFSWVDIEVTLEERAVRAAISHLRETITQNPVEVERAKEEFKKALAVLISLRKH